MLVTVTSIIVAVKISSLVADDKAYDDFNFVLPQNRVGPGRTNKLTVHKTLIILEFICQMDVGIPCPAGVDKDLWQRFEAFEKWNAAH